MRYFLALSFILLAFSCGKDKDLNFLDKENFEDYSKIKKNSNRIIKSTFVMLSSELKSQMKIGGVVNAIEACKVKAPEIEDKISKTYEVNVRRTSNKVRNYKNSPDDIDSKVLDYYLKSKEENSKILSTNKNLRYYQPIKTGNICLSCHGDIETQIGNQNYSLIKKLYPKDMAFNYKADEFRGLWVLEYKKK